MKTNTLLIAALAFGAGYYAKKLWEDKPATGAAVGASWPCQKNPNGPGCQGGQIHTLILPFPAKASWPCQKNPNAPGCQGGNLFAGQPRVAGI